MNATRPLISFLVWSSLAGVAAAQRPAPAELEAVSAPAIQAAPPPALAPAANLPEGKKEAGKTVGATMAKTGAPPPLTPRFQQVRTRIDALFLHRNEAPPPVDPRSNPFRGSAGSLAAGAANASGGGVLAGPPVPVNPEMQLLQQAASALKVAGVIQINGRDHLIINQAPYKEGDVIIGRVKGQPVYLRLKVISRFTFTLTYNDSELAVKY